MKNKKKVAKKATKRKPAKKAKKQLLFVVFTRKNRTTGNWKMTDFLEVSSEKQGINIAASRNRGQWTKLFPV